MKEKEIVSSLTSPRVDNVRVVGCRNPENVLCSRGGVPLSNTAQRDPLIRDSMTLRADTIKTPPLFRPGCAGAVERFSWFFLVLRKVEKS